MNAAMRDALGAKRFHELDERFGKAELPEFVRVEVGGEGMDGNIQKRAVFIGLNGEHQRSVGIEDQFAVFGDDMRRADIGVLNGVEFEFLHGES